MLLDYPVMFHSSKFEIKMLHQFSERCVMIVKKAFVSSVQYIKNTACTVIQDFMGGRFCKVYRLHTYVVY